MYIGKAIKHIFIAHSLLFFLHSICFPIHSKSHIRLPCSPFASCSFPRRLSSPICRFFLSFHPRIIIGTQCYHSTTLIHIHIINFIGSIFGWHMFGPLFSCFYHPFISFHLFVLLLNIYFSTIIWQITSFFFQLILSHFQSPCHFHSRTPYSIVHNLQY